MKSKNAQIRIAFTFVALMSYTAAQQAKVVINADDADLKEDIRGYFSKPVKKQEKNKTRPQNPHSNKVSPSKLNKSKAAHRAGCNFTVGVNFCGVNELNGDIPQPNGPMGGVCSSQILVAANPGWRSFNIDGTQDNIIDGTLNDIFGIDAVSQPGNVTNSAIDAQLRFDRFSGKWIVVAMNDNTFESQPLKFYIGASDCECIATCTKWTNYTVPQATIPPVGDADGFIDVPWRNFQTLGVDEHALYIGASMDSLEGGFLDSALFVVQKESLLCGGPLQIKAFRGLATDESGIFIPQGVTNFDENPEFGYFIGIDRGQQGKLILYRVINPGSSNPTLSAPVSINLPANALPIDAPHKSIYGPFYGPIITLDDRLSATHVRDGQLYTAQHIGVNANGVSDDPMSPPDRTAVRFYQFDLSAGGTETVATVPTLVQSGTLFDDAQRAPEFYYFPSIMTNKKGDIAIGGTTSGENSFVNAFACCGDVSSDGSLSNPVLVTDTQVSFNRSWFGVGEEYLGPYSYIAPDVNDVDLWSFQCYSPLYMLGGTQVTQLKFNA